MKAKAKADNKPASGGAMIATLLLAAVGAGLLVAYALPPERLDALASQLKGMVPGQATAADGGSVPKASPPEEVNGVEATDAPLTLGAGQVRVWIQTEPAARVLGRGKKTLGAGEYGLRPGEALTLALGDGVNAPRVTLKLRYVAGDLQGEVDAEPAVRISWGGGKGHAPPLNLPPVGPGSQLVLRAQRANSKGSVQIKLGLSQPK
jgi:hypothetical protein